MSQKIQAQQITLHDLHTRFNLSLTEAADFFPEWQGSAEVTQSEKSLLDQIRASFLDTLEYPTVLEDTVKMVVMAPLLLLADFYRQPFHIKTESTVALTDHNEGLLIEGRIDILILTELLWVLVVESKRASLSIGVGLAQLLAYMLTNPHPDRPGFGLISNGESFIFVKVAQSQYATSRVFHLRNPGNDLYEVLGVLKRLGQLTIKG